MWIETEAGNFVDLKKISYFHIIEWPENAKREIDGHKVLYTDRSYTLEAWIVGEEPTIDIIFSANHTKEEIIGCLMIIFKAQCKGDLYILPKEGYLK